MNKLQCTGIAVLGLALPAPLAQAHHEVASAVNGEGIFLALAALVIGVGVFVLQPRA